MKKVAAFALCALVLIASGCIFPISHRLTPAKIDEGAKKYVEDAEVAEPGKYDGWLFPTMYDLQILQNDVAKAHAKYKQIFKHMAEEEQLEWKYAKGMVEYDIEAAQELENAIFNPKTGALAFGLSLMGIGAGGYLGAIRKRKGDFTPEEHEAMLAEVKGEVTNKDRAILQLVGQFQKVLDGMSEEERTAKLKELKAEQLPETRTAVKEAKVNL